MVEVRIPDLGDASDVEVIEVLVSPGDQIELEASMITVESDKASMDIPSTAAGTVKSLAVEVGSKVNTGDLLAVIDDAGDGAASQPAETAGRDQPEPAAAPAPEQGAGAAGTIVKVPDIGDFTGVEIIEVLVAEGQQVQAEDGLVTLETDKATMEVPSPAAGTVQRLLVKVGDKVSEGDDIAELAEAGVPAAPAASTPEAAPATPAAEAAPAAAPAKSSEQTVTMTVPDIGDFDEVEIIEVLVEAGQQIKAEDSLITLESDKASMDVPATADGTIAEVVVKVGDKVAKGSAIAHVRTSSAAPSTPAAAAPAAPATAPAAQPAPLPAAAVAPAPAARSGDKLIHASPAVRKIAREYGVDLGKVKGSGGKGRILKGDIKEYVKQQLQASGSSGSSFDFGYEIPAQPHDDFSKYGAVEDAKLSRIKQLSGPNLHRNWLTVPHVTQFDDADVTDMEDFRKMHGKEAKDQGFSLSPLAFLIKAATLALQRFPEFNSSISPDGKSIVLKKHYHVGIAVDTAGGLVVPVIRDTNTKAVMQIAREMAQISASARAGKLGPKDMKGGTFTISSLGGIGGSYFTPIVNSPEVAILGVGRSRYQPVWNGSEFKPRLMMPLALSYDHRVVDGAMGARFITHLSTLLTDIRNIVL